MTITASKAESMTNEALINEVLKDEKTGCSDRPKLAVINMVLRKRTGKTSSTLLNELGL